MAFTDPPYNVDYGHHGGAPQRGRRRTIANDALPPKEWEAFCRNWAKRLLDHVDGALYICMSTREWPTVSGILDELGVHWSDTIIWAIENSSHPGGLVLDLFLGSDSTVIAAERTWRTASAVHPALAATRGRWT
jgi:DNA modification methylase